MDVNDDSIQVLDQICRSLHRGCVDDENVTLHQTTTSLPKANERVCALSEVDSPLLPDILAMVDSESTGLGTVVILEQIPEPVVSVLDAGESMTEWAVGKLILELILLEDLLRGCDSGLHPDAYDGDTIFQVGTDFKVFGVMDLPEDESDLAPIGALLGRLLVHHPEWELAHACKEELESNPLVEDILGHMWFDRCRVFRRLELMLSAKKALGPCAPVAMTNLTALRIALLKYRFRRLGPRTIVDAVRELCALLSRPCRARGARGTPATNTAL
eukprot:GEMP01024434.1.p1 GENE.GEMP01024434.1~~GEMP01024434.1.p1  ORF type:complete len:273 (+),score=70.73 GEMP01024434.1:16-834(+)